MMSHNPHPDCAGDFGQFIDRSINKSILFIIVIVLHFLETYIVVQSFHVFLDMRIAQTHMRNIWIIFRFYPHMRATVSERIYATSYSYFLGGYLLQAKPTSVEMLLKPSVILIRKVQLTFFHISLSLLFPVLSQGLLCIFFIHLQIFRI